MFFSDFNPRAQRAKQTLAQKAYRGSNLTQNLLASQPVKKINEDKNKQSIPSARKFARAV